MCMMYVCAYVFISLENGIKISRSFWYFSIPCCCWISLYFCVVYVYVLPALALPIIWIFSRRLRANIRPFARRLWRWQALRQLFSYAPTIHESVARGPSQKKGTPLSCLMYYIDYILYFCTSYIYLII